MKVRIKIPKEMMTLSQRIWTPDELKVVHTRPKTIEDVLKIVSLYRRIGVPVLPSKVGTKHQWTRISWSVFQKPTLTEEDWRQIEGYFVEFVKEFGVENLNFVGITHASWNYMLIDFDIPTDKDGKPRISPEDVLEHILEISREHGLVALPCWVVFSGKGLHLHVKPTPEWVAVANRETGKPNHMQIGKENQIVIEDVVVKAEFYYRWRLEVLPPSIHPDLGVMYRYHKALNPATTDLRELPESLLRELLGRGYDTEVSDVKAEMELGLYSPEEFIKTVVEFIGDFYLRGQRHWCVLGLAGTLRRFNIPQHVTTSIVETIAKKFEDEELGDRLKCVETTYSINLSEVAGAAILCDGDKMKEKPFSFEDVKTLYQILSDFDNRRKVVSFPDIGDEADDEALARLCFQILKDRIFVVKYDDDKKKIACFNPVTGLYVVANPTQNGVLKQQITQLVEKEITTRLSKGKGELPKDADKIYKKIRKKVRNRAVKEVAERLMDICETEGIVITPADLVPPPDTFVLPNGVVQLVTETVDGETDYKLVLLPHSPHIRSKWRFSIGISEETLQKVVELFRRGEERRKRDGTPNIDFSELASNFYELIRRFGGGKPEYIDYIERVLGYLISGHASEECFFIIWGIGGAGKTTLTRLLRMVFGDFAYPTPTRLLKAVTYTSELHEEIYAEAFGKRLIIIPDLPANCVLSGETIKTLAGRDDTETRSLWERRVLMEKSAKPIVVTNTYPEIADVDSGVVRRLRCLPWLGKPIPLGKAKKDYEKVIWEKEREGVMAALLFCYLKWRKHGLEETPEVVRSFTAEILRSKVDIRDVWVKDRIEVTEDYTTHITFKGAYEDFLDWVRMFGYDVYLPKEYLDKVTSGRDFAAYMKKRFSQRRSRDKEREKVVYKGLRFKWKPVQDDGDDFDDTPPSDGTNPFGEAETETRTEEDFPFDEAERETSPDGDGVRDEGEETTFGSVNPPNGTEIRTDGDKRKPEGDGKPFDGSETQPNPLSSTGLLTYNNNKVEMEKETTRPTVGETRTLPEATGEKPSDGENLPTLSLTGDSDGVETEGETLTRPRETSGVRETEGEEIPTRCFECGGVLKPFHDTGYLFCYNCCKPFSKRGERLPTIDGWRFSDKEWDWCPHCNTLLLVNPRDGRRLCGNCKREFTEEETRENFVCVGCGRHPDYDPKTGYFVCRHCREVYSVKGKPLGVMRIHGWKWDVSRRCLHCNSILMVENDLWWCPNCGKHYEVSEEGELEELPPLALDFRF